MIQLLITSRFLGSILLFAMTVTGCVSLEQHERTQAELEKARAEAAETAEAFDAFKEQSTAKLQAMEQERGWLSKQLVATQNAMTQTQIDLQSTQYHLTNEQQARHERDQELSTLRAEYLELERASSDLRWECQLLQITADDLSGRLELVKQAMRSGGAGGGDAGFQLAALEQEQTRLQNQLIASQGAAAEARKALETTEKKLAGEQKSRRDVEFELASLRSKNRQLERLGKEMRRVRDFLQVRVDDLTKRLQASQRALTTSKKSLNDAQAHIEDLEQEKRTLKASLAAEQEIWTRMQNALTEVEGSSKGPKPK